MIVLRQEFTQADIFNVKCNITKVYLYYHTSVLSHKRTIIRHHTSVCMTTRAYYHTSVLLISHKWNIAQALQHTQVLLCYASCVTCSCTVYRRTWRSKSLRVLYLEYYDIIATPMKKCETLGYSIPGMLSDSIAFFFFLNESQAKVECRPHWVQAPGLRVLLYGATVPFVLLG